MGTVRQGIHDLKRQRQRERVEDSRRAQSDRDRISDVWELVNEGFEFVSTRRLRAALEGEGKVQR